MPPASIPEFLLVAPHEEFVARVRPGELVKRLAVAWAPEFEIEGLTVGEVIEQVLQQIAVPR